MTKLGVLGDRDFALLFKAVGLEVFFVEDGAEANKRLRRLAREGYHAVFVQEKYYPACRETVNEFAAADYPAIIPLPDGQQNANLGMAALKANVEKAVGVDILFNN